MDAEIELSRALMSHEFRSMCGHKHVMTVNGIPIYAPESPSDVSVLDTMAVLELQAMAKTHVAEAQAKTQIRVAEGQAKALRKTK